MAASASDFPDRLAAALGPTFRLERELGGGGMSRVFLAHDLALDRRVVVKVLPPELAGVNVDRFRREIQLSAQLQHPHIVPVLQAGQSGELLYYTMPYVEGESLRARLERGERLPIGEAVRILLDVVDALAHAHARGIVHRDIKPENILLSGRHALVTDFGVARGLSEGERVADAGQRITGVGVAIGTPTYMSPEQAAGDPGVDERADLYGFGVLAYELLAGRPPFDARSAHELLAAHLAEQPAPVDELCADLPPALAGVVMSCLEKRPDDRPRDAAEVREAIESVLTPTSGTSALSAGPVPRAAERVRGAPRRAAPAPPRARLATLAGVGLVALAAAVAFSMRPRAAPLDEHVVAVVPFRITGADPSLRFLREGMLDLLAAKLTGEAGPRSADPRRILAAWRRAAGSDTADLPRTRTLDLAQDLGAGQLLLGDIGGTPARLVLNASLIRVRDGRAAAMAHVEGPADSLPRMVDQLAAQLLAIGAGEGERLETLTSTSLDALRAFLDGQWMYRRGRYRDAAREFDRALQLDSTFALAGLHLAIASGWYGDPALEQRGMLTAWRWRERLSPHDRVLLDATAGPRFPAPSSAAERTAAARRFLASSPDRAEAWFQYADGLFHWGGSIGIRDAEDSAAFALRRALALDSTFTPALEHLVLLEARVGDTAEVRRLAARYLEVDSAGENADGVRWRAAEAMHDSAALRAIRARRDRLTAVSAHTIRTVSQLDGVGLDLAEAVSGARVASGDPTTRLGDLIGAHDLALNRGHVARALAITARYAEAGVPDAVALRDRVRDALFWDGDTTAAAAAARVLARRTARAPADSAAARASWAADLCTVELWRLARGDARTARRTVETLRALAARDTVYGGGAFGARCGLLLDAMLASMQSRPDADRAIASLDSLLRAGPSGPIQDVGNLVVARLHEARGHPALALAALRRRDFFLSRTAFLTTYLREEARLAASLGQTAEAVAAYRHYLALRAAPDPSLAAERREVERRLARLGAVG
ncbi:MAG TPA: serine/threonine-protein kinase [Gemmatimonadaceae bacterium]